MACSRVQTPQNLKFTLFKEDSGICVITSRGLSIRVCLFMEVDTICLSRMRMWSSIQKKETQSHVWCMSNICYICGKHYENSYYITEHKKTFHGKSENLPCEVCGEIFVNRRRLKGHKTRNHTDNTYHQCKVIKFCSKLIEASVRWQLKTSRTMVDWRHPGGLQPLPCSGQWIIQIDKT